MVVWEMGQRRHNQRQGGWAGGSPPTEDLTGKGPIHMASSQEEYSRQNIGKMKKKRHGKENWVWVSRSDNWEILPPSGLCFSVMNLVIALRYCELTMGHTLSSQHPSEVDTLLPSWIRGSQGTERQ